MGYKERDNFFNEAQEHSKAKLSLLKNYATTWMRKVTLGTMYKKCAIIDTFAGAGYYEDGSEGSPIILIKSAIDYCIQSSSSKNINFDNIFLVFVEKDKDIFNKLKENIETLVEQELKIDEYNVLEKYEKVNIYITNNDFETFINTLLTEVDSIIPTLMFIDPFGYKVLSFDNISKLIEQYDYCELLINFMYEEINRFFLAESNEKLVNTLKDFYGPNLEEIKSYIKQMNPTDRRNKIIEGYKDSLKSNGVKYTLDFDIEKNGKVKMNIIFCTKNLFGFDTMKNEMHKVCNNVNFEYHTKNPQLSLFDEEDETKVIESMAKYLYKIFNGKVIEYNKLFVKAMEHPYIPSKYLKKSLKKLEEKGLLLDVIRKDGNKRKKYTYPDCTIIKFRDGEYE